MFYTQRQIDLDKVNILTSPISQGKPLTLLTMPPLEAYKINIIWDNFKF